ncbi:MAG: hypothetical protein ABIY55_28840, partial [Kofleriaceae bacterium]
MDVAPVSEADLEGDFARRAPPHGLREQIGSWVGRVWAPGVALISRARHARMFHPEGLTFAGHVRPQRPGGALDALAERFAGRVLVRCSAALWRG